MCSHAREAILLQQYRTNVTRHINHVFVSMNSFKYNTVKNASCTALFACCRYVEHDEVTAKWKPGKFCLQPPIFSDSLSQILRSTGTAPHLHRDCATSAPGLRHICAGTAPHLRRDHRVAHRGLTAAAVVSTLAGTELLNLLMSEHKAHGSVHDVLHLVETSMEYPHRRSSMCTHSGV